MTDDLQEPRASRGPEEAPDAESSAAIPSAALAARSAPVPRTLRQRLHTEREIWTLAWPAILAQMLASAVSLIDIAMIGRLGTESIAAVGYATQYQWLTGSILYAVGTACVALMARFIGAGEPERARQALGASLLVASALAVGITAVVLAFPRPLLAALAAPLPVIERAVPYFQLTLGSTLLLGVAIIFEHGLRADRDTRTPMLIVAAVTVVKIVLNALLIFGLLGFPKLGLAGAGLATLISQVVAFGLFVWVIARQERGSPVRLGRRDLAQCGSLVGETVRIAMPAVAERVVMNLAIMAYFVILGSYGPVVIAAYTVGVRILSFSWLPGFGFSIAAATLVGQALGAGDARAAERAGWRAARMALVTSVLLGGFYALARVPLAELFTTDRAVIVAMEPFMLLLALAQPFMGLHFALGGALRGAGDTLTPLWAAGMGNWVLRVPLALACARWLQADVIWVWSALIVDHVARSVYITWIFRRGRWRQRRVG